MPPVFTLITSIFCLAPLFEGLGKILFLGLYLRGRSRVAWVDVEVLAGFPH